MMNGHRQQGRARLERAVAVHHLQHDGDQEQQPAEGRVDDERHRVGRGELPGPEQPERQHGLRLLRLDQDEQAEQTAPAPSGTSTDTEPHPYEDAAISP